MLTLCRLPGPVSIRPPQSPQLKPFTFFTTREREPGGDEHLYLHMGYFATLADAEKWAESVRGRFPDATATIAPGAFLRPSNSEAPAAAPADSQPAAAENRNPAPVEDKSLTDTQVLRILETRGVAQDDVGDKNERKKSECEQIALLRPEDTGTRHALKEAVVQGAPVSFAVQLQWSAQPIDLSRVPAVAIFKAHTLYATASHREGHSRYFLRLGFFADPISARQVAAQVRANFASAAVVPVSDQEVTRARAAGKDSSSIPSLVEQEVHSAPDSNSAAALSAQSEPVSDPRPRPPGEDRKLELALKRLARREMWTNSDVLGESGVRHLKVKIELQRRKSGRAKGVGA
jgi:hypothetical protein